MSPVRARVSPLPFPAACLLGGDAHREVLEAVREVRDEAAFRARLLDRLEAREELFVEHADLEAREVCANAVVQALGT